MSRLNSVTILMLLVSVALLALLILLVTVHRANPLPPVISAPSPKVECFKGRDLLLRSSPKR